MTTNRDRQSATSLGNTDDDVLDAVAEAVVLLEQNDRRTAEAISKGKALMRLRERGLSWDEILLSEEPPLLTAVLADSVQAMRHANSRVRRAQAEALRAAGVSMARIARLFAVSRQRVAALLGATGGSQTDAR
jgi:hypothetical protein